jgi:nucleotide-binding universal stress UspA family protein
MPVVPSTAVSFSNILLLTDFGPASAGALAYSLAFARHFKARLYPAHVIDTVDDKVSAAELQQMEEAKQRQLSRLVEYTGIQFEPLLSRCDFDVALSHWVAERGIDLVILGTHGRNGVQRFLLGSTSEAVLQNALCPVLTVGPQVRVPRLFNLSLDKILFAAGLGRHGSRAFDYALSLARERCARLMLLHVLPTESRNYLDRARVLRFTLDELQKLLPGESLEWCRAELAVDAGAIGERIVLHAQAEQPDLIVMGLSRSTDFTAGSNSGVNYRVISAAPCPVLSVPEAGME